MHAKQNPSFSTSCILQRILVVKLIAPSTIINSYALLSAADETNFFITFILSMFLTLKYDLWIRRIKAYWKFDSFYIVLSNFKKFPNTKSPFTINFALVKKEPKSYSLFKVTHFLFYQKFYDCDVFAIFQSCLEGDLSRITKNNCI